MPTQLDFFAALLLGIGPALAILWASLRPYDRPRVEYTLFDDRRVFGSLAVGMIFGVIASVLGVLTPRADFVSAILGVAATFAFEETFKLVYLNRRAYQGRFDTAFNGVALGAGAASTAVVASVYWFVVDTLYVPEVLATFLVFSVSLAAVNVDTGAIIGHGAGRGEVWRPLGRALAIRYAHAALLFPFLLGAPNPWSLLAASASAGFAFVVFDYVRRVVLPECVPEAVRRKARRERRRSDRLNEPG